MEDHHVIADLLMKNGDLSWDFMEFMRIYDGIPSGELT